MTLALALNPAASVFLGVSLAATGLVVAYFVWRGSHKRFVATHGPTFHRLCDGLGVGWLDRWRLRRLADKAGLITPAVLLISRGAFENALVRAAVPEDRKWLQRLRASVFDDSPAL